MAFGFSSHHTTTYNLQDLNSEQFLILAIQSAINNGWKIGPVSSQGFLAYTKFSLSSWGEEIIVKIDNGNAIVKSRCTGGQIVDYGKNKKNIELLLNEIKSEKENFTEADYIEKQEMLRSSINEELELQVNPQSTKEKLSDFLFIFKPSKGYFITPILINLNIGLFLLMVISGVNIFTPDNDSLLLWGANFKPLTLDGEWWRLITAFFLHIGLFHLLFNMFALVYIGLLLEPYLGKARFLTAYILTGITASLASLWWHDLTISAGASGAIFGMYGVFLAMLTTNLIEKAARTTLLISIALFVGYNLLSGMDGATDNAAHIGGLLSGIIIGYAFYPSLLKPKSLKLKQATIAILTTVVLISSMLVYSNTSNDLVIYDAKMMEFAENEDKGLQVYSLPETTTNEDYLAFIKEQGIPSWEKNVEILKELQELDLPSEIKDRNLKLLEYCYLRITSYKIVYSSIEDDTDLYQAELEDNSRRIEEILNDLSDEN